MVVAFLLKLRGDNPIISALGDQHQSHVCSPKPTESVALDPTERP
jgi:hypothetical protein